MKEHERTVNVIINEIHLQPYFDYKDSFVTGAAAHSSGPAEKAQILIVQSLLSNHKDVHILPLARTDTNTLHEFLRKIITDQKNLNSRL